jgi:hypothetical protein
MSTSAFPAPSETRIEGAASRLGIAHVIPEPGAGLDRAQESDHSHYRSNFNRFRFAAYALPLFV